MFLKNKMIAGVVNGGWSPKKFKEYTGEKKKSPANSLFQGNQFQNH
jgi:hypothetical protein